MSVAGCKAVYLGVESGSQKVLKILNKNITVRQIKKAVNLCKRYNINTYCSLIVGVPGESYKDYLLTEKLMQELKPYKYNFNVFVGIPDSPLYKYILDNNLYEYKDEVNLLYLPGYDVKTKFFYHANSKRFVDYDFKQRTDFDKKLLKVLGKRKFRRKINDFIVFNLRHFIVKVLKKTKRILKIC